jgi:hypothetical protein
MVTQDDMLRWIDTIASAERRRVAYREAFRSLVDAGDAAVGALTEMLGTQEDGGSAARRRRGTPAGVLTARRQRGVSRSRTQSGMITGRWWRNGLREQREWRFPGERVLTLWTWKDEDGVRSRWTSHSLSTSPAEWSLAEQPGSQQIATQKGKCAGMPVFSSQGRVGSAP